MKVKSFRAPRLLIATVALGRTVLRGTVQLMQAQKQFALAMALSAIALGGLIWPHDVSLLETIHFWSVDRTETARRIAWYLGTFGDYPTYNVPVALAIWGYGVATKNRAWRRIAVIAFLGATLAGLFDDCFRLTLGRPRPDAHIADGFYGLLYSFRGGFQSFPSGHAAAVFGTACALLVCDLPLGVLAGAMALAVIWARMELYRHYPSDIAVGSMIGIYFGLVVGLGAKVRRKRTAATVASA